MRQEDPEKKQPHRAKVYLATHKKKAKDKNEHVLIDEQPELAQNDQGKVAWQGDALHKVLGNEKPGQVHGMGLLPIPKQVYGKTLRYLKNINMTSKNVSHSDGEIDNREEIEKLKKRIEQQDRIIEALKNKEESHANTGISMENRKSLSQAVHAKRKRVHCNGPGLSPSMIEQGDAIVYKEASLRQQNMFIDDENVLTREQHPEYEDNGLAYQEGPSSPQHHASDIQRKVTNNREKMNEKLITGRQNTQHQTLGHISSMKRPMEVEVGTQVILKSSIYPNKRRVAYATFLSCKSKTVVGGVELGRQFTHVRVDKPIEEDETLVRERTGCKIIGDAFTSGLSIAWPSACIEKII